MFLEMDIGAWYPTQCHICDASFHVGITWASFVSIDYSQRLSKMPQKGTRKSSTSDLSDCLLVLSARWTHLLGKVSVSIANDAILFVEQALKSGHPTPSNLVSAIDPDAPTRENAHLHPQDLEDEELLMRAVWTLLKAGRLSDARQLCRDVGQAWRAASLGGTGDAGPVPSVEGFRVLGGKKRAREEQAAEIEAGRGRQRRLWKWTCYMASEKVGRTEVLALDAASLH